MTTHAMSNAATSSGSDAALRWIGDLDHPFYDDERNRYVWYEAQAIGFQFIGFGSYLAAAISLLVGGSDAIPYAWAMLAPFLIAAIMLKGYVSRRGADYWPQSMDFRRSRGLAALAVMVLLFVGFARAYLDRDGTGSGFWSGLGDGAIVGMVVGAAAAGVGMAYGSRRQKKEEADLLNEEL